MRIRKSLKKVVDGCKSINSTLVDQGIINTQKVAKVISTKAKSKVEHRPDTSKFKLKIVKRCSKLESLITHLSTSAASVGKEKEKTALPPTNNLLPVNRIMITDRRRLSVELDPDSHLNSVINKIITVSTNLVSSILKDSSKKIQKIIPKIRESNIRGNNITTL